MKKRISAVAIVVICLAILATGTLAYFTDAEQVHNIITSGNIKIDLEEFFPGSEEDPDEENTYILDGVMPGQSVTKEVRVKNTGVGTAWIRAKLTMVFDPADLPTQIDGKDVVSIELEDGWIDGGDGWYYYNTTVAAGAYTDYFFREVTFAPEMGNEYQRCSVSIIVDAQAVQAANNIPDSGSVLDVAGWPND